MEDRSYEVKCSKFLIVRRLLEGRRGSNKPQTSLVCGFFRTGRQCSRGAECSCVHARPKITYGTCNGLADPRLVEFFTGDLGPLNPPKDESVKTLGITQLNSSVLEQDIRDRFCAYGEIESIRFFQSSALLTYTTRQAAEKAIQELSSWFDINGQRLKLLWGLPRPDLNTSNQQGTVTHSQQQNQPPPQRIGAVTSTQEVGSSSSSENHGASSSSSYQMPPHREEPENKRRKIE